MTVTEIESKLHQILWNHYEPEPQSRLYQAVLDLQRQICQARDAIAKASPQAR